jgi:hypothetical protein
VAEHESTLPMRWTAVTELGMREKPCCCPVNMKELGDDAVWEEWASFSPHSPAVIR